jgi:glycosyltransferase involved in cell wall biosynthesis
MTEAGSSSRSESPVVSVGVPVRNEVVFIERSLSSVLAQD